MKPTSGVSDFETSRLDAANSSRPDDGNLLLVRQLDELPGLVLRNTFGNDRNRPDLLEVHGLHGALVGGPQRSKVHQNVRIWVLVHAVIHLLVNCPKENASLTIHYQKKIKKLYTGYQNLFVAPVVFLFMVASERINNGDNTRLASSAHEVEVQHALNGPSLHSPDDGLGFR